MIDEEALTQHEIERAIKTMLANVPRSEGGELGHSGASSWHPLKPRTQDGTDTVVVFYSFEKEKPDQLNNLIHTEGLGSLQQAHHATARRAMNAIEAVADIRFVEAGKPNAEFPEAENMSPNQADVHFYSADTITYSQTNGAVIDALGVADGMKHNNGPRSVIVRRDENKVDTFIHEISHAVAGLCHLETNKFPSPYDHTMSNMSSYFGEGQATDFGVVDIAAWQHLYGASQIARTQEPIITLRELADAPVIYSAPFKAPTLDFRNTGKNPIVDLRQESGVQIYGNAPGPGEEEIPIAVSVAAGTRIQNIIADPWGPEAHLRGNNSLNKLEGSHMAEVLMPTGNGDMLIGNSGADYFRFDAKSGRRNIIKDFATAEPDVQGIPQNDKIQLALADLKEVNLASSTVSYNGTTYNATELQALDANGNVLASTYLVGQTPEAVKERIFTIDPVSVAKNWRDMHAAENLCANITITASAAALADNMLKDIPEPPIPPLPSDLSFPPLQHGDSLGSLSPTPGLPALAPRPRSK